MQTEPISKITNEKKYKALAKLFKWGHAHVGLYAQVNLN